MREPTKEDSFLWANTPMTSREETKQGVVEMLEGSNTKYHLRREGTSSLRLVGVEEEQ